MLNLTLNRTSLILSPELAKGVLSDVLMHASSLRGCYPSFDHWIQNKVIPGLDQGERAILTEYRDGHLAGFAIVKDDGVEKKLCCLRVIDEFQKVRGLGVRLFERAFEELVSEKPLLSVAEEHLPAFARIFSYYGFQQSAEYTGRYRPEKTEYAFNGLLDGDNYIQRPRQREAYSDKNFAY